MDKITEEWLAKRRRKWDYYYKSYCMWEQMAIKELKDEKKND